MSKLRCKLALAISVIVMAVAIPTLARPDRYGESLRSNERTALTSSIQLRTEKERPFCCCCDYAVSAFTRESGTLGHFNQSRVKHVREGKIDRQKSDRDPTG